MFIHRLLVLNTIYSPTIMQNVNLLLKHRVYRENRRDEHVAQCMQMAPTETTSP